MVRSLAALSGILGVLLFIAATIIGGLQSPEYSHVRQYISETYATGTPWGEALRYYGFIPSGFLIALFALFAMRSLPGSRQATIGFLGLGLFYGSGTVVCSVFICDAGCGRDLTSVSESQLIHNAMGLLTYVTVPPCLLLLGVAARGWPNGHGVSRAGSILGGIALMFVGLFLFAPGSPYAGLVQRVIEGAVLAWILVCAFHLRPTGRRRSAEAN